jgi:hypothetical protein
MEEKENCYITGGDAVYYPNAVRRIKKSQDQLRPIYEIFTNSLEAIQALEDSIENEYIKIKLFHKSGLFEDQKLLSFDKLVIEDSGIGFNKENFNRFKRLHDNTKGPYNLGSGRIQLTQFFKETIYESIYEFNKKYYKREFVLSNSPKFQKENSILFLKGNHEVRKVSRNTIVSAYELLDNKDCKFYNELTVRYLKERLISHYIMSFCTLNQMPQILLEHYVDDKIQENLSIQNNDIPKVDNEKTFSVFYSKLSNDGKEIFKTDKKEEFIIKSFRIDNKILEKNEIKLTSKNEIVEDTLIKLQTFGSNDSIYNKRYLFLVSSDYFSDNESDTRGILNIPTAEEFRKGRDLFSKDEILLDDIEQETNSTIISIYPEIEKKLQDNCKRIEELQNMFLLSDEFLTEVSKNLSINDSDEKILREFYAAESKQTAKSASLIKKQIDELKKIDPTDDNYEDELTKTINSLVKEIPLQNRAALTQYVARRQIILELFDKVLKRELVVQNDEEKRKKDECLLHNIIFKQKSHNSDTSDLWLVNEDFILFSGSSETKLQDIEYNGEKIIKSDDELTKEQIEARDSLDMRRYQQRLDTILFPDEGKCVIIEFKSPDVSMADHLTQIQNYATLIRNFSKDQYDFTTFYGYLIGEKANLFEIRNHDPNFREAQYFDYFYKPISDVAGYWGKKDGVIYTEIIKYTTLLERAKKRNNIFIDKIKFWSDKEQNEQISSDDVPF